MNENDIKNLKDLQFTITENMKNITIEMFTTKQMLDECELSKKDRKLLEKHFEKLKQQFAKELQEQNPVQVMFIRNYLSSKKEKVYLFSYSPKSMLSINSIPFISSYICSGVFLLSSLILACNSLLLN